MPVRPTYTESRMLTRTSIALKSEARDSRRYHADPLILRRVFRLVLKAFRTQGFTEIPVDIQPELESIVRKLGKNPGGIPSARKWRVWAVITSEHFILNDAADRERWLTPMNFKWITIAEARRLTAKPPTREEAREMLGLVAPKEAKQPESKESLFTPVFPGNNKNG